MIRVLALVLLALSLVEGASAAVSTTTCNIPVFRYALERWHASAYEVVAYHRGALTDDGKAALNVLRQAGANVDVDRIDVAGAVPEKRKALLEKLKLEAPCLVAIYPGTEIVAWTGPLTSEAAKKLADSPARREIARRLMGGESAVWLMLDSGDTAADSAAAGIMHQELKKLEQALKLPPRAADDPPLLSDVPIKIAFSLLRVARTDAAEAALVTMLINSEPGLAGPIVYPIFGRGRALWAMAGKGLTAENIMEAGAFLVGACSCEAKEQNPGLDLLVAAEWESGLAPAPEQPPVPTPLLRPRPAEPEPTSASAAPAGSSAMLWGSLVVAGLFVAVTGRRLLAK